MECCSSEARLCATWLVVEKRGCLEDIPLSAVQVSSEEVKTCRIAARHQLHILLCDERR